MILRIVTSISMILTILLAFLWAPAAAILGDASRIIYFHVPLAMGSVVAFVVAGIFSILYLVRSNKAQFHLAAYDSAHIGMLYTILTVITGSIWAKISWGTYWNWDPRETSIVILLLIYIAYFSLYSTMKNTSRRGAIGSVYLIFAMVVMPFFVFVVPRMYHSLHPETIINSQQKVHMEPEMRLTLLSGVASFLLLYALLFHIRKRYRILLLKLEESYEKNI